jgi:hypothetical protein
LADDKFDRLFVGPPRSVSYSDVPSATLKRLVGVLATRLGCDEAIIAAHLRTVQTFQSWKQLQIAGGGGDRIRASLRADSVDDSRDASWCLVSSYH